MPAQASSGELSLLMTLLTIVLMYALYYLIPATLLLSFLQVYLCRRNIRWGRILPIVSAVLGVLAALAVAFLTPAITLPYGLLRFLLPLAALVIFNIPTLVYFLIYRYQKRRRAREDLKRMKIDDLE